MELTGKRVLITGSSRGIGLATAIIFASKGALVAVNGRTDASTQTAVSRFPDPKNVIAIPGDVSRLDGCISVVEQATNALSGLDVLVNNAGVASFCSIEDTDEQIWDNTIDTNLKSTYFCIKAALDVLKSSKGNVVNVASDAGLQGEAGLTAYCASKGGVVTLTKALAIELAPQVRVNCVCPGYVDTDMVRRDNIEKAADPAAEEQRLLSMAPLRRLADPSEVGNVIAFLASDHAKNVTGATWQIDGGSTAGQ
tara:strand:+ start:272 stop:1030 length:759 start_codon:yes stop_codon:yes gene_type:complete